MLTTKEYLVLDSGRILHYVIKKKGVRKKQKDRSEQKSPSQFHHTNSCLIALPFLPAWPIPFETQQVEKKKRKKSADSDVKFVSKLLLPSTPPREVLLKQLLERQTEVQERSFHKGRDLMLTPVHTGGEERIQERHSFPGPLESLGCFSSCSACFKGARDWELLVIFLLPAIPGYQSRGFAVEYRADLKLISLSFLPSRYLFC